jgi:hypothetical protein
MNEYSFKRLVSISQKNLSRDFLDFFGKRNKHGTPLVEIRILGKTGGDEILNWIKKNLRKRAKVK